jgi:hypothetical protein
VELSVTLDSRIRQAFDETRDDRALFLDSQNSPAAARR